MSGRALLLKWSAGADHAVVGPLQGRAEAVVAGVGAATALAFLDGLLVPDPAVPGRAAAAAGLAVPDRDRVLADVYRTAFGDTVESTVACEDCGAPFELSFSLAALVADRDGRAAPGAARPVADGVWEVDGVRFRLPTGADELAAGVAPDPEAALVGACLIDGPAATEPVAAAMAELAPLIDAVVGGTCPECGATKAVSFDVQRYLLRTIQLGRPRLQREVHLLAVAYGWSRAEILDMTQADRRAHAAMVIDDRASAASRRRM